MNHASSIMDRIPLAEYPIQNVRGAQQNKQLIAMFMKTELNTAHIIHTCQRYCGLAPLHLMQSASTDSNYTSAST